MLTCKHCRQPVQGDFTRIDAGTLFGYGSPNAVVVPVDINLCNADRKPCYALWMLEHYPWLADVHTRERTRLD